MYGKWGVRLLYNKECYWSLSLIVERDILKPVELSQ